jgi:hypothetical protein
VETPFLPSFLIIHPGALGDVLQAAGVGMLFIPTFLLPADRLRALDRFMAEVTPAFR